MKRRTRISFMSTAFLIGSLTAAPSLANSDGYANTIKVVPQPLEVKSNGHVYTGVPSLGNIVADVRVEIATTGSLSSWKTYLKIGAETVPVSSWDHFEDYPAGDTFGQGDKPDTVNTIATIIIPAVAYEAMALAHCNDLADDLRHGGYSDEEIFGQDRILELGVRASIQWDSSSLLGAAYAFGPSDDELPWESLKKLELLCKKHTPIPAADTVYIPHEVEDSTLTVLEHATLVAGRCRMTLSGVIETTEPDIEVSFRYKDDAGNQSKVHDVVTDHAGISMFSHSYDVPIDPQGPESGKVRIVGVSHSFESARQTYEMDCEEPRFEALRPPNVEIHLTPMEEIRVGQQYCYSKLKFYAKIIGQSTAMSGQGIFIGDYYLSKPQPYAVEPGQTTLVGAEREIDWAPDAPDTEAGMPGDPDEVKQQTIQMGFNLTNANGTVVVQVPKKPYTIKCRVVARNPMAVQAIGDNDGITAAPRPQPAPAGSRALRPAPRAAGKSPGQPAVQPTVPLNLKQQAPGGSDPAARLRRMQRQRLDK